MANSVVSEQRGILAGRADPQEHIGLVCFATASQSPQASTSAQGGITAWAGASA